MSRRILYSLGLCAAATLYSPFTLSAQHQCGVHVEEGIQIKNRMFENRRNAPKLEALLAEKARTGNNITYVPVQFHIVNKSDGTGGETVSDILENLCTLNDDYRNLDIQFYMHGPIRYINQDLLYNNERGSIANSYMGMYKVDGAINVYVGNDIIEPAGTGGSILGYYTSLLDIVYCIKGSINGTSSTLTHEMGHYFSLNHTFFGWENKDYIDEVNASQSGRTPSIINYANADIQVENIARGATPSENCQIAADGFCDTKPNYLFGFYGAKYNKANICVYDDIANDPEGNLFIPTHIQRNVERYELAKGSDVVFGAKVKNTTGGRTIFNRTKMMLDVYWQSATDTILLSSRLLGDTDSTRLGQFGLNPADNGSGGTQIISPNKLFGAKEGIITMNGSTLDYTAAVPSNANVQVGAIVGGAITQVGAMVDSITITNTSATDTIKIASTDIVFTKIFQEAGQAPRTSTETKSLVSTSLSADILPGETVYIRGLQLTNEFGGGTIAMEAYAPNQTVTLPDAENYMSYYNDACTNTFSPEQGVAIKLDVANRGLLDAGAPNLVTITDKPSIVHPLVGASVANPLMQARWTAVTGATLYHVKFYKKNGFVYNFYSDYMATTNELWLTLEPGEFEMEVIPYNSTYFCVDSTSSGRNSFLVNNWAVGVDQVANAAVSSKVYPNPAVGLKEVSLEIAAESATTATVSIYNALGQEVMPAQTIELLQGDNIENIDLNTLPTGMYLINVQAGSRVESHKLMLQD